MAGHSKWANIQHRKNRQDEKRGKVWTRLLREIAVSARTGGGELQTNARLRLAVEKARGANMPADTIKKNIDKATGQLQGVTYDEIRYEGYGPGGAAIILDSMTDNRTRTVAEVRHALSRQGGNLAGEGAVAFMFRHCGQLLFAPGTDAERAMEIGLAAGADDVLTHEDGMVEVLCAPGDFEALQKAFAAAKMPPFEAEITMRPNHTQELQGEAAEQMHKLIDALEDLDDTQALYHNAAL